MSALDLIRPDLRSISRDVPGEERPDCRLHMNELPWSPIELPNVALNHYPMMDEQNQLAERLANHYQIPSTALFVTRGSDEGIDLLMRLFLQPGVDSILQCSPTFSMYAFYARIQQAGVIECPLACAAGFNLELDALIAQWQPSCKLIILCRPNNPTANLISAADVAYLCSYFQDRSIVVVDEAYIEFSDAKSVTQLINQFDNLVVLRTLSKAYGLAGLRLGVVIAQPSVINALKTIIAPFTVSSVVIELGLRALQNHDWFATAVLRIKAARSQLMSGLQQSKWIEKVYPSTANFILVQTCVAQDLFLYLKNLGVAVRQFTQTPALQQHLRITVGSAKQNQRLLHALDQFRGER